MSQNNVLIIAIIISLVVGIGAGVGICYFFLQGSVAPYVVNSIQDNSVKKVTAETLVQKRYPDVIKGTLNLAGDAGKIKADDGKEYLLWPSATGSYFKSLGYQDGQKGEFQGKILLKDTVFKEDRFAIMPQVK